MKLGNLDFQDVGDNLSLVAKPVEESIKLNKLSNLLVAEIDAGLADTAAFCEHYKIGLEVSANCVIVEAKRADKTWYAACVLLATTRADINNMVRRHLDARKISFAPMDTAVNLTKMEFGGITPIGLPADWPILVDTAVANSDHAVIGSGIRGSKLLVPGKLFLSLPNTTVLDIVKTA